MYHLLELSSSELQSNADVSEADSWILSLRTSGSDVFHWKKSVMSTRKSKPWSLVTLPAWEKHHLQAYQKVGVSSFLDAFGCQMVFSKIFFDL